MTRWEGRTPPSDDEEADALLYVAFTVAWTVLRAAIEARGIYGNHRTQCLNDFRRICGDIVDTTPFDRLFAAWENWDDGAPSVEEITDWIDGVAAEAKKLRDAFGPGEGEKFTNWPPRTI